MFTSIAIGIVIALVAAVLFGVLCNAGRGGEDVDEGAIPFDELHEREYGA
jgi:hypothetical protein